MPKKMIRRPWTKDDIKTLRAGAKSGIGSVAISKQLKRTESATRQMAFVMGLSLRTKR